MAPSGGMAVVLLVIYTSLTVAQELVEPPQNTTVFLNQTAVFRCVTRSGENTGWRVNGTGFGVLPRDIRDDLDTDRETVGDNELNRLTIPGRVEYNGTVVQCVTGVIGGDAVESLNATLKEQGLLAAVGNLATQNSSTSINISWSSPPSLDVTGVDPDIWYNVFIYNVTDEENPTAVLCTDCLNLTQTRYIFRPDHPSPCHKYNFTVISQNGAGQGESSHNVTGYTIDKLTPDVQFDKVQIKYTNSGYSITFFFVGDVGSVCNYILHIVDPADPFNGSSHTRDGRAAFLTLQDYIKSNKKYVVFFEIINAAESITTPNSSFTTFDVQNATAKVMGDEIQVTGEFIINSPAKGCFVVLWCEKTNSDFYRAISQSGDSASIMTDIPSVHATYTVNVYDVEKDGLPNPVPALELDNLDIPKHEYPQNSVSSKFLKRAEISKNGSEVTITCEFMDDYPEASCVLVYREYDNMTLTMAVYNWSMEFPVTITVDSPEEYTFSLFGRNGMNAIEGTPVIMIKMENRATYPSRGEDKSNNGNTNSNDLSAGGIVGGVVGVAGGVAVLHIALLGVVLCKRTIRMKRSISITVKGQFSNATRTDYVRQPSTESRRGLLVCDGGHKNNIQEKSKAVDQVAVNMAVTLEIEKEETKESKYATLEEISTPGVPPPRVEEPVQYQEIDLKATKRLAHPHGLFYEDVRLVHPTDGQACTQNTIADNSATQYAEVVLPHATSPTDSPRSDVKKCEDKVILSMTINEAGSPTVAVVMTVPPTEEGVMALLWSVAGQWKDIAEGLEFDEDLIDEIFTNNETDEACLQVCVEKWMRLRPTWEKLAHVLSDMGEESLAEQAWNKVDGPAPFHMKNTEVQGQVSDEKDDKNDGLKASPENELPKQLPEQTQNKGEESLAEQARNKAALVDEPVPSRMESPEDLDQTIMSDGKDDRCSGLKMSCEPPKETSTPLKHEPSSGIIQEESDDEKPSSGIIQEESDDDSFTSAVDEASEGGDGGPSELVGKHHGQAQNDNKHDDNRGSEVIMKGQIIKCQPNITPVTQPKAALQEESHIANTSCCVLEEENGNVEDGGGSMEIVTSLFSFESPPYEVKKSQVDSTRGIFTVATATLPSHPEQNSVYFESPSTPFTSCTYDYEDPAVTTAVQETTSDNYEDQAVPAVVEETTCESTTKMVCELKTIPNMDQQDAGNAGHRDFPSDGPVTMTPQTCTDDSAGDSSPTSNRAVFTHNMHHLPDELCSSSGLLVPLCTGKSVHGTNVLISTFFPLPRKQRRAEMVIGEAFTSPSDMEMQVQVADVYLHDNPITVCNKPPPKSHVESTVIEQPPENTPPQVPGGNPQQSDKPDAPVNKCQMKDPPGNYQEMLQKWMYTGIALGFHGPDSLANVGRNVVEFLPTFASFIM